MDLEEKAFKEIELLQAIITRQLEHSLKVRGWLIILISGLTVAAFREIAIIAPRNYLIIGILITFVFMFIESMQHSILHFARERMASIESMLRDTPPEYDGPRICISLKDAWKFPGAFSKTARTFLTPLILGQFLAVIILVFVFYFVMQAPNWLG